MAREDEPCLLVPVPAVTHLVVLPEQLFAGDGAQRVDVEGLDAEIPADPDGPAVALLRGEPFLERQRRERGGGRHRVTSRIA
jgi:hypothetical protein